MVTVNDIIKVGGTYLIEFAGVSILEVDKGDVIFNGEKRTTIESIPMLSRKKPLSSDNAVVCVADCPFSPGEEVSITKTERL